MAEDCWRVVELIIQTVALVIQAHENTTCAILACFSCCLVRLPS